MEASYSKSVLTIVALALVAIAGYGFYSGFSSADRGNLRGGSSPKASDSSAAAVPEVKALDPNAPPEVAPPPSDARSDEPADSDAEAETERAEAPPPPKVVRPTPAAPILPPEEDTPIPTPAPPVAPSPAPQPEPEGPPPF